MGLRRVSGQCEMEARTLLLTYSISSARSTLYLLRRYKHTAIHGINKNMNIRGRNHHGQKGRSRVPQPVHLLLSSGGGGYI